MENPRRCSSKNAQATGTPKNFRPEYRTLLHLLRTGSCRSRRKPIGYRRGLKVRIIEECVINGHKFCYRLTVVEVFHDKVTGLPRYTTILRRFFITTSTVMANLKPWKKRLITFARGHIPSGYWKSSLLLFSASSGGSTVLEG